MSTIDKAVLSISKAVVSAGLRIATKQSYKPIYQPIPWLGINSGSRAIPTVMRWEAIDRELDINHRTAQDIGCNIGYFTFKMAERGIKSVGIDSGPLPIYVSKLIKATCAFRNVTFVCKKLDPTNIVSLDDSDVIICLSIYHHFVSNFGQENAKQIMKELLRKTTNVLFFETGQSDETYMGWAKKLPDMGRDPSDWIRSFLFEIGASDVKILGKFPTHLGDKERYLFAVYR